MSPANGGGPKDTIRLKTMHIKIAARQAGKLCGQCDFADTDLLEILYFFLRQE